MADPARLKTNADMAGVRVQQWLLCQFELARADHMHCAIRRSGLHHRDLCSEYPALALQISRSHKHFRPREGRFPKPEKPPFETQTDGHEARLRAPCSMAANTPCDFLLLVCYKV
jgi:hypothetical protein